RVTVGTGERPLVAKGSPVTTFVGVGGGGGGVDVGELSTAGWDNGPALHPTCSSSATMSPTRLLIAALLRQ
ncbi:MAG: hypothetical protein PVH50_09820, partial [Anaerolineae bacterium]